MADLDNYLVVALEQAVAAPYASNLLAEAGARVIKIERQDGDFARNYDHVVHGESAYFVWLNRGKESLCLDVKDAADKALLINILQQADVFVQNLKPGAVDKLGLGYAALQQINPSLVMCSISGYGECGADGASEEYAKMKAYDLLVQAESGLCAITGSADEPARVGVSICDIATGLTAYSAILRGLLARGKSGVGSHIEISLFGVMADWMNVPLLHQAYSGEAPKRMGICHPSIAPYGVYTTGDGKQLVFSIQNEREWQVFCAQVLDLAELAQNPLFASNVQRVANRAELDRELAQCFAQFDQRQLASRLLQAGIAYGRLNELADVLHHPQLRQVTVDSPSGELTLTASGVLFDGEPAPALKVPDVGEHSSSIREEFATYAPSRSGDSVA
jgi:crotonobetainyl-CoA:carnitine CoA-transferase CaiB-like acyl-CoA transferase